MIGRRALVVDASVATAIVRAERDGPPAAATILDWARDGARIVVPSHFWLEVTNSLLRGHGWSGAAALEAIRDLDGLRLEIVDLDRAAVVLVIDLCERHGLTAYDATYLALALSLDASIATFDRALAVAAGPRVVPFGQTRLSETPVPYESPVTWPSYRGASAYLAKLRAEAARPG